VIGPLIFKTDGCECECGCDGGSGECDSGGGEWFKEDEQ